VRFPLGRIVATPGALELVGSAGAYDLLLRHAAGDWGDLDAHDRRENEISLKYGFRVLSSYPVGDDGDRIWILTEADRSSTCILTPEEY